ncbi:MAG: hypothetical protein WA639_12700 [Candidatus Acidiferrum sp.]
MPDQDNIQERLKTAQEECQRLSEENAHLRAMLGINQSPPTNPFHKQSATQSFRPPQKVESPRQRRKSRSFEICFVGVKMFSPFVGKERVANLAIHLPASWTGVPSMSRNQKNERKLPAKQGCFNH